MSKRSPCRYTCQLLPSASALAALWLLGRKLATFKEFRVVLSVAGQAGAGVLAQSLLAATAKARGVRIDALPHAAKVWPSPADGVVVITPAQVGYMLEGIDWRHPLRSWQPQAAG